MKRLFLIFILLTGCSSFNSDDALSSPERERQMLEEAQNSDLARIQNLVNQNKNEEALQQLDIFRKNHKHTPFYQASRIVEAQAYYNLGNYQEALKIYKSIESLGPDRFPRLWAQARYESSFCYEALGDQEKVLSILVGLEKSKAALSEGVSLAELPARLAAVYSEKGLEKEARAYLDKADAGLNFLINKKSLSESRPWLAETLFRMGIAIQRPVTAENFSQIIRSQKQTQTYLLRSMEQGNSLWSQRAYESLVKSYIELWDFSMMNWNSPEELGLREAKQKELHQLLTETLYRKPVHDKLWNESLRAYFSFAEELDGKLKTVLLSGQSGTKMTEESLRLNAIKRPGQVKATKLLPEEKQAEPEKVNKKDPNL